MTINDKVEDFESKVRPKVKPKEDPGINTILMGHSVSKCIHFIGYMS